MEVYLSGRNEPHSKCGCPKGHVGSNPTASATGAFLEMERRFFFCHHVQTGRSKTAVIPRRSLQSGLNRHISPPISTPVQRKSSLAWIRCTLAMSASGSTSMATAKVRRHSCPLQSKSIPAESVGACRSFPCRTPLDKPDQSLYTITDRQSVHESCEVL